MIIIVVYNWWFFARMVKTDRENNYEYEFGHNTIALLYISKLDPFPCISMYPHTAHQSWRKSRKARKEENGRREISCPLPL